MLWHQYGFKVIILLIIKFYKKKESVRYNNQQFVIDFVQLYKVFFVRLKKDIFKMFIQDVFIFPRVKQHTDKFIKQTIRGHEQFKNHLISEVKCILPRKRIK